MNGYKLRIASRSRAVFYKSFAQNKMFNQILCIYFEKNGTKDYACIELANNDMLLIQKDLADMQMALNNAKSDLREFKDLLLKEVKEKWLG